MVTAKPARAADKSQICRKLVTALQKLYGKSVPRIELPVVETMLFAACLEDNPWGQAEASLKKLLSSYFDLNEIRVSSVSELEHTLAPLQHADWKGLRIRSILRFVFESTYSYDFERLRRQTLEQAVKTLKKVNDITPFIRDFVLHEILGSHVVCIDGSMLTAARWLGLVPLSADHSEAAEYLKGGVRKSEVSEFCHLLRCVATDPRFLSRFEDLPTSELPVDGVTDRLEELLHPPKKKPAKIVTPEPVKASPKKPAPALEKPLAATKSVAAAKPAGRSVSPAPPAKSPDTKSPDSKSKKKPAEPESKASAKLSASPRKVVTANSKPAGKPSGTKPGASRPNERRPKK